MKKLLSALVLLGSLFFWSGCAPVPFSSPAPSTTEIWTNTPVRTREEWLMGMNTEQKIGQVMVIGFDGITVDAGLREMITRYHVGGVILFARNVESPAQVARLCADMQKLAVESGHPGLLIAIDQEGGRVARLTEAAGFTEFPGAMAVAAAGNVQDAQSIAAAMAQEMRAVGINTDFAPDLDVNNNPLNPVIGIRSYGSEPEKVAEFGTAVITGLQQGGVLAFGKHFPGHGDTGVDSHVSLPSVAHERERLEAVEFVPFKAAMQAGAAGIMSAHVTFPAIDDSGVPATLSMRVLTDLIRTDMGYDGLVVTDSLEMGALGEAGYPVPLAAARALQSGADLLLFNRDHGLHRSAIQKIQDWLADGTIPAARLDEAVSRVLAAKEKFNLLVPQSALTPDATGSAVARELSRQVARQSITLLRDEAALLPLSTGQKYLVVEVPGAAGLGNALGLTFVQVGDKPGRADLNQVLGMARDGRTVIVATTDANRNAEQAAFVQNLLKENIPVIVVAMRSPYDLLAFPEVGTYLAAYGANPPALAGLADVLWGKGSPQGKLPVDLPGLYSVGDGMTAFQQSGQGK